MTRTTSTSRETIESRITRLEELRRKRAELNAEIYAIATDPEVAEHQVLHNRRAIGLLHVLRERDISYSQLSELFSPKELNHYVSRLRIGGMATQERHPNGPPEYFLRITPKGRQAEYAGGEDGR